MYLLDTDIIIYSLKGHPQVIKQMRYHAADPKALSVITYGELVYGAQKSANIASNLAKVHRLRELFPIIELTCAIMDTFGSIKAEHRRQGTIINDFDLIIAASAITLGYIVVSHNEKHFSRIQGLKVESWARG